MAARYFIGASAAWNLTSSWATASGGAGPASVPTASDDVILDAASGNCNITASAVCRSLDATNYAGTVTQGANLSIGTSTANGTLAFKLGSGAAWSWSTGTLSFVSTSATQVQITTAGIYLGGAVAFSGAAGSWLVTDGIYTSAAITHTNGTLNFGPGSVVQATTFATTGTNTRALTLGAKASVYLQPSTTASWTASGSALTMTCDPTSQIVINSSTVTFAGGGYTYGWLTFTYLGANYVATITGSNTFAGINNNGNASLTFTAATTQTITSAAGWMVTGDQEPGGTTVVKSTTNGTAFTVSCSTGNVVSRNVSMRDCHGSGGATFYAGSTSTATTATNTGWSFTDPTTGISRVSGYPTYAIDLTTGQGLAIPGGAVGDPLIVTVDVPHDTAVTISGGGVATWHQAARATIAGGAESQMVMWWGIVTSAGAQTISQNYTVPGGESGPDLTADCYHSPSATWGSESAAATWSSTAVTTFAALTPSAAQNLYVGVGHRELQFNGFGATPGFTEVPIASYPFLFVTNLNAAAGLPLVPTLAPFQADLDWVAVAGVFTPAAPAAALYVDWI